MRRNRRRTRSGVDLIGFLDILSVVMVIVLLIISILALSTGVQVSAQDPLDQADLESQREPVVEQPRLSLVEIKTTDGQNITSLTAFLLCKGDLLQEFDPISGDKIRTWNLTSQNPYDIARTVGTPNVYLAVAGSCFPSLDPLVDAFRSSGLQLGYEPTTEEAVLPWQ